MSVVQFYTKNYLELVWCNSTPKTTWNQYGAIIHQKLLGISMVQSTPKTTWNQYGAILHQKLLGISMVQFYTKNYLELVWCNSTPKTTWNQYSAILRQTLLGISIGHAFAVREEFTHRTDPPLPPDDPDLPGGADTSPDLYYL